MYAALQYAGYDAKLEWGEGNHSGTHGASVLPRPGGRPPKLAPLAPMGIEIGDDPPSPVPKTLHGGARDWFAFLHGGAQAA